MTGGLVACGSALYAASCRSPTASKNSPTAQTTTPATTAGHQSASSTAPTITGRATNHWTTPCTRKTRRATPPMPIWEGGPPSISAYRGSSLPPCSPTARPPLCQASRRPPPATIAATTPPPATTAAPSQRRQPVPSSSNVPTTATTTAISAKPAPHATSTTAALSSCFARIAAAVIPAAAASSPARRATRTGATSAQLRDGQPRALDGLRRVPGPSGGLDHGEDDRPAHAGDHAAAPLGVAVLGEGIEQAESLVAHRGRPPGADLEGRRATLAVVRGVPAPADPRVVAVVLEHAACLVRGAEPDDALEEVERRSEERVGVRGRAAGALVDARVVAAQR